MFFLILFFLVDGIFSVSSAFDSTWPKIHTVSTTETGDSSCFSISHDFQIVCEKCDPLSQYFVNRTKSFVDTLPTEIGGVSVMKVEFLTSRRYFGFDIYDGEIRKNRPYEYYELTFDGKDVSLKGYHVLGILRGLQTFEQIIFNAIKDASLELCKYKADIVDFPRYRYRGILIDTARNFYTIAKIKEIIRNMYLARYTVLHIHLTDSQSLPFNSTLFQKLVDGSFPGEKFYTEEQIEDLRIFAFLYGIEIIIEIDLPGHSYSFAFGYPSLLPVDQTDCLSDSTGCSSRGQPCSMTLPNTRLLFDLVGTLINETSTIPQLTNFFGLGFDEFSVYCWENDPVYQSRGFSGYCEGMFDNLLFEFLSTYSELVKSKNLRRIAYDDIFLTFPNPGNGGSICKVTKSIPKDSIILLVWGGSSYYLRENEVRPHEVIQEAVSKGFEVIVGNYERWYFGSCASRITSGDEQFYKGIYPEESMTNICADPWKRYWMYDPTDGISSSEDKILGGEGLLWETPSPVALAALGFDSGWETDGHQGYFIGERLWSPKSQRSETDRLEAKDRIQRLVKNFRGDRLAELTTQQESEGKKLFLERLKDETKYWDRPTEWIIFGDGDDNNDVVVDFASGWNVSAMGLGIVIFCLISLV